mmetsp:Transcript_27363/g.46466  ORF Transcript_27363/g.46466 Transcript_27363/m.46466 type:complete len:255 (+) Transcript_27363:763-1527(+)
MSMNSLGPCALLFGPSTPVITNCALGNISPSIPMKGMVPPSPWYPQGLLKNISDAPFTASLSHGSRSGMHQPEACIPREKVTRAPWGGSRSSTHFTALMAFSASAAGGRRMETTIPVYGRRTFPAFSAGGSPETPVTARQGFQALARPSSEVRPWNPQHPSCNHGTSFVKTSGPSSSSCFICSLKSSGMSVWHSGTSTSPFISFSILDNNCRTMRKVQGTMPPKIPLWMPSASNSTFNWPLMAPRRDVVSHIWS